MTWKKLKEKDTFRVFAGYKELSPDEFTYAPHKDPPVDLKGVRLGVGGILSVVLNDRSVAYERIFERGRVKWRQVSTGGLAMPPAVKEARRREAEKWSAKEKRRREKEAKAKARLDAAARKQLLRQQRLEREAQEKKEAAERKRRERATWDF